MSSWPEKNYQYLCPPPTPKAKVNRNSPEEVGAMTGDDYDLMLHCTIGHMRRVDGALPDFEDGEKALNFFAPPGEHRCICNIFFILCIFCI